MVSSLARGSVREIIICQPVQANRDPVLVPAHNERSRFQKQYFPAGGRGRSVKPGIDLVKVYAGSRRDES